MPEVDLNVTYCRAVEYHDELMRFKRNIRTRLRFVAMNYCVPTPSVTGAFEVSNRQTGRVYYSKLRHIGCGEEGGFPDDSLAKFDVFAAQLIEDGAVPIRNPPPFEGPSGHCSIM